MYRLFSCPVASRIDARIIFTHVERSLYSAACATGDGAQDSDQDTGTEKRDDDGPNQSVGTRPMRLARKPPRNAPTMPMTISPTIPYPPRMTTFASKPATRPTTSHQSIVDRCRLISARITVANAKCYVPLVMSFTHLFDRSVLDRANAEKQ